MKFISAVLLAFLVSGSAFAGFDDVEIVSNLRGEYVLGILVSDQREGVLKWDAKENLIGAHHSGMFRSRKDLLTGSEGPVSDEMLEGLRKEFSKRWLTVAPLSSTSKDSNEAIGIKIRKAKLHRSFVVTVHSIWVEAPYKGDTTINYGLTVSIMNDAAVVLARKTYEGISQSTQWGYWGATEIFGTLMSSALADPEITNALLK